MTRLEFGKHAGRELRDIPTQYLAWCLDTLHKLSPAIRMAIRDELDRRGNSSPGPTTMLPVAVSIATARQIVAAGRRTLARSAHPDVGGNPGDMVVINATSDWIEQFLRSVDREEVA